MQYIVYEIKNNINGKIYIGVTNNMERRFKEHCKSKYHIGKSIRKYGKDNFSVYSIYNFSTIDEAYNKESEIVNEDFLKRLDTMNEKLGGKGGWNHLKDTYVGTEKHIEQCTKVLNENREKGSSKIKYLFENDKEWADKVKEKMSISSKKSFENGRIGSFKNKEHSDETKKKISEANSKHQKGKGNSQFGTMWIYNLEEKLSKKIRKEKLEAFESLGWLKGRKIKF